MKKEISIHKFPYFWSIAYNEYAYSVRYECKTSSENQLTTEELLINLLCERVLQLENLQNDKTRIHLQQHGKYIN